MPAYHIERSIRIDAPPTKVRPAIEDFAEWPKWSPWLCMEPDAKLDVHGTPGQVGHGYDWDGELVGAGNMHITVNDGEVQQMDLGFLRPFRSEAKVKMEIRPAGDGQTNIAWHMDGKMPFFLFFMIKTMKAMIGMDYDRGLKMLKELVETGTVQSQTEIVGIVDGPTCDYIGVEANCSMDDIGKSMEDTMSRIGQLVKDHNIDTAGPPGVVYHCVDIKGQQCHYSAMVPVKSATSIPGTTSGTIAPHRALKIVHTGRYENLGNGWSTAMAYQRHKKLKQSKSVVPFEFYTNDPSETPAEDLIAEIYVPIRG